MFQKDCFTLKKNCLRSLELFYDENRQYQIVRLLGVHRDVVSRAIRRFNQFRHESDHPGRGRICTVNMSRNLKIIKKRINHKSDNRKAVPRTSVSVSSRSKSCSRMKRCIRWNKCTITKTTDAGVHRLQVPQLSSNTQNPQSIMV